MLKPGKAVWLEEHSDERHTRHFSVYQVYDNLLRRMLATRGVKTEKFLGEELAGVVKGHIVRSQKPWRVRAATGARLRAIYVFRNDADVTSPQLMAHRLGIFRLGGSGEVSAAAPPFGVNGKGTIDGDFTFAIDPEVRFRVVAPWQDADLPLDELIAELCAEIDPSDIAPAQAEGIFNELFADYLPEAAPDGWDFEPPPPTAAEAGDTMSFSVSIDAPTPGQTLFAIQVEDISDPANRACSQLFALEVNEQLEMRLLTDVEPLAAPGDTLGI